MESDQIMMLRMMGFLPSRPRPSHPKIVRTDPPADIRRLMSLHDEVVGKLPPHMVPQNVD